MHLLILNGPNLNLLGTREPAIYGNMTLQGLEAACAAWAQELSHSAESFQSNHEGELIDRLHQSRGSIDGIVFNAGAFTHTSYALHDAIVASEIPTVEVHISNVMEREPWRTESRIEPACIYSIYGRGVTGYRHAISRLHHTIQSPFQRIDYGSGPDQFGELRKIEGPSQPLAVLIHGGFWRHQWTRDTLDPLAVDLFDRGISTLNLEYSRAGLSRSSAPDDIALALKTIKAQAVELGLNAKRIAIIGHSAGGQLALQAAIEASPALAVSLAGVTNLVRAEAEGLGRGAAETFLDGRDAAGYCPSELLPTTSAQLLVHGDLDESVPVSYSKTYADAVLAAGGSIEFHRHPDADHMDVVDPNHQSWQTTARFIEEKLLQE